MSQCLLFLSLAFSNLNKALFLNVPITFLLFLNNNNEKIQATIVNKITIYAVLLSSSTITLKTSGLLDFKSLNLASADTPLKKKSKLATK